MAQPKVQPVQHSTDHHVSNKKEPLGKRIYNTLNERFGLDSLAYEVPAHANTLPYTLGGITAVSTIIAVVSGILLANWYTPTPELANFSIRNITENVYLGYVIRGVHSWSAQIALVALVLHLLRVFVYGSYKRPREGNWFIGVFLFLTMIGLFFTGTIAKWDQEGNEALEHAQAIAGKFGLAGYFSTENVDVITRFFIAHVSILPLILFVLLFIHILLIKKLKISPLPWKQHEGEAAYKNTGHNFAAHFKSLLGYGYIVLGVSILLAIFFSPKVGPEPLAGIEVTKPLWPFLWIYTVEEWWGIPGATWVSLLLVLGMFAVPFIDRGKDMSLKKRAWFIIIVLLLAVALLLMTIYAYNSSPVVHLDM
ncbi:cytochrome b N-terminal domain-containing protein [Microaerobacter geothermalis]|uniref:cytochrome b N-terminal domain-containing protein n=1 Tax=Microaerobacter geothermalis TaxID=674972 RepID=UPI001F2E386F|nr:cytochrome b N-terminal domain-containing protein [Microaerobacter geothermalis]MCF6094716.1 cytochrome b N-terminal domain-containing protein [Microaerobacter geothermalis]